MPKASLDQMLATIPAQALDQTVTNKHLAEIAKMLTNWKFISPYLGISEAEVEAIEEENKTSNERRYALDFLLVRIVCSSVLILAPSVKFDGLNKRLCT